MVDPIGIYLAYYLLAGGLFALVFVSLIAGIIDQHAREATPGFMLMIFPTSVLLWPIVMLMSIAKLLLMIFPLSIKKASKKAKKVSKSMTIATDAKTKAAKTKAKKAPAKKALKTAAKKPKTSKPVAKTKSRAK